MFISSPDGETTYILTGKAGVKEGVYDNLNGLHFDVAQINKDGICLIKKIPPHDYGYSVATFCNNNYLYFLTTKNGNENALLNSKKASESLVLNQINSATLSYKRIDIEGLPSFKTSRISHSGTMLPIRMMPFIFTVRVLKMTESSVTILSPD